MEKTAAARESGILDEIRSDLISLPRFLSSLLIGPKKAIIGARHLSWRTLIVYQLALELAIAVVFLACGASISGFTACLGLSVAVSLGTYLYLHESKLSTATWREIHAFYAASFLHFQMIASFLSASFFLMPGSFYAKAIGFVLPALLLPILPIYFLSHAFEFGLQLPRKNRQLVCASLCGFLLLVWIANLSLML